MRLCLTCCEDLRCLSAAPPHLLRLCWNAQGYAADFYPKIKKRMYALGKEAGVEFNHKAEHNGSDLHYNR